MSMLIRTSKCHGLAMLIAVPPELGCVFVLDERNDAQGLGSRTIWFWSGVKGTEFPWKFKAESTLC